MTLPPLLLGTCTIGARRYPAIVGKVKGETREMFVCGVHIDRFVTMLARRGDLRHPWQFKIEVDGREL